MPRFLIAIVGDANVMPSAAYLAARLGERMRRPDTEIAIYSDSIADLNAAKAFGVPASLKLADFSKLPQVGRFTGASFFRMFLPHIVPVEVERILYLDTDISIEDAPRLFRLFDLDMHGKAIAGVRDCTIAFEGHATFREESARAGPEGKYLNTGVLLIDRQAYIDQHLSRRFTEAVAALRRYDQSATNAVLRGDWLELSPAMNMMLPLWNSFVRAAFPPALVHFVGDVKPWHAAYCEDHPIRQEMTQHLARSPWPHFMERQTFAQAWAQKGPMGPAASPRRKFAFSPHADIEAIAQFLRTTTFADVEQGITEYRNWEIPAPGAATRELGSGVLRPR
jgi:lipopolysaccharide biosynthesis glycosyltransferase